MTTKIKISNESNSNGDVVIRGKCLSSSPEEIILLPGEFTELWVTTSSSVYITETWPTKQIKEENK